MMLKWHVCLRAEGHTYWALLNLKKSLLGFFGHNCNMSHWAILISQLIKWLTQKDASETCRARLLLRFLCGNRVSQPNALQSFPLSLNVRPHWTLYFGTCTTVSNDDTIWWFWQISWNVHCFCFQLYIAPAVLEVVNSIEMCIETHLCSNTLKFFTHVRLFACPLSVSWPLCLHLVIFYCIFLLLSTNSMKRPRQILLIYLVSKQIHF